MRHPVLTFVYLILSGEHGSSDIQSLSENIGPRSEPHGPTQPKPSSAFFQTNDSGIEF